MTTTRNTVLPFDKAASGDNTNAVVERDGEYVGEIEKEWDTVWTGMSCRYVVSAYTVRNGNGALVARFEVDAHGSAARALAAAKASAQTLRPL